MHKKLSSSNEFHNEENLLIGLENVLHTNKERMISLKENFLFQKCWFNLIIINNDVFSQRFHSIYFSIISFLNQENFTERTSTNYTFDIEVLELTLFVSGFSLEHSIRSSISYFLAKSINFIKWIIWRLRCSSTICFSL